LRNLKYVKRADWQSVPWWSAAPSPGRSQSFPLEYAFAVGRSTKNSYHLFSI
jgi:hypothetical protein